MRKQILSAIIYLYLFSHLSARIFSKRGCGGIPPPNPFLPPHPSGAVRNFSQNGFALNSEYATLCQISCSQCARKIYRRKGWIKENIQLGHKSFCSKQCFSNNKKTGRYIVCRNDKCNKFFYRVRNDIAPNNYCSHHCAAVVNNRKRVILEKVCACNGCNVRFWGENKYCSEWCAKLGRRGYTQDDLVKELELLVQKLKRTPTRRESYRLSDRCRRIFGSWNNAVVAAG